MSQAKNLAHSFFEQIAYPAGSRLEKDYRLLLRVSRLGSSMVKFLSSSYGFTIIAERRNSTSM